jgi:hypothetical protein
MRRKSSEEKVKRLRRRDGEDLLVLARKTARWAKDNLTVLEGGLPESPSGLHDRAADAWEPLFAIADQAGGEWPERARHAALALAGESAEETEAPGITLLGDLRELFAHELSGVLFTRELIPLLCEREDRSYGEFHRGRRITPAQIADLLKPFGIPCNKTVRRGNLPTAKGYRAADFADAWARYLPGVEAVARSQLRDSAAPVDPGSVTGDARAVTPGADVTEDVTSDRQGVTEKS